LLDRMGIDASLYTTEESSAVYLDYGLNLVSGNKPLAVYGKVKNSVLNHFDIKQEVFYAEIDWELCMQLLARHPGLSYSEIPRYPEARRDLALLLDKQLTFGKIEKLALKNGGNLLRNISLFDIYEGDQVEKGKKSYAVSFILRDDNKTLKDEEIDAFMNKLVKVFEKELNAQLR